MIARRHQVHQRTLDIAAGCFLLAFAITVFALASQIRSRIPIGVDSGFFPEIASGILAALSVLILVQGVRTSPTETIKKVEPKGRVAVWLTLFLMAAFGTGAATVGFIPAAATYLIAQFYVLSPPDNRKPISFVVIGIATTVIIYFIFTSGFGMILPTGFFG